jgi:hypothetical protein
MRLRRPTTRRVLPLVLVVVALAAAACRPPGAAPVPGAVTVMGPSELTAQQIANWVCQVNRCTPVASGGTWKPEIDVVAMAQLYIDEGNAVGVRGDIAFCQSVHETGWFAWPNSPWPEAPYAHADDGTWPGYVLAWDHNYAGLGAFNGTAVYMRKATPQTGVRAHLQHLRNYADAASTSTNLGYPFESRIGYGPAQFDSFQYKGQAPTWVQLNGKWAVPGTTYGQNILRICNDMRTFAGMPPLQASSTAGPPETYDAENQQLQDETDFRN